MYLCVCVCVCVCVLAGTHIGDAFLKGIEGSHPVYQGLYFSSFFNYVRQLLNSEGKNNCKEMFWFNVRKVLIALSGKGLDTYFNFMFLISVSFGHMKHRTFPQIDLGVWASSLLTLTLFFFSLVLFSSFLSLFF